MKRLPILLLLLWTISATAAVTRVQSSKGTVCGSFGTTCAVPALGSNQTAGNINLVCASWMDTVTTGYSLSSVSDTKGNTYSVITVSKKVVTATAHYTEIGVECAYTTATIGAGANTITCTFSAGAHYEYCSAYELTGQAASGYFDNTSGTVGNGSGTAISAGAFSTTANGEFGVTQIAIDDGIGSPGFLVAGSGWTMDQNAGTANHETGNEFQAQSTAGTLTGNMTAGATGTWIATMIVFTPGSSASSSKIVGNSIFVGGSVIH